MKSCPITYKIIDQNIVRIIATEISILGVIFIIYPNFAILALLLYDFFVRMLGYERLSPLYNLAIAISKLFKMKKDKIDAGPKEFTLKIGFLFALISSSIYMLDQIFISVVVIATLTVCTLLEALFNYCIGCKSLYYGRYIKQFVTHRVS